MDLWHNWTSSCLLPCLSPTVLGVLKYPTIVQAPAASRKSAANHGQLDQAETNTALTRNDNSIEDEGLIPLKDSCSLQNHENDVGGRTCAFEQMLPQIFTFSVSCESCCEIISRRALNSALLMLTNVEPIG